MNPVTGLALGRITIGVLTFLAPRLSARIFQLDADATSPYVGRLFASREIVIGAATLASSGEARTRLLAAGVAIDGADGVAGVLAARNGEVGRVAGGMLIAPAVAAVAVGLLEVLRSRSAA